MYLRKTDFLPFQPGTQSCLSMTIAGYRGDIGFKPYCDYCHSKDLTIWKSDYDVPMADGVTGEVT